MNNEKLSSKSPNTGEWDSLADMPFKTSGGYVTKSGIILTGEAGRAQFRRDNGEAPTKSHIITEARATTKVATPIVAETKPAAAEATSTVKETTPATAEAASTTAEITPATAEATSTVTEAASATAEATSTVTETAPTEDEFELDYSDLDLYHDDDEEIDDSSEKGKINEVAYVQGTEEAEILKKDPDQFIYQVSEQRGFAVPREDAVNLYLQKMQNAKDDQTAWQAIRMGYEILEDKSGFSEEEKAKVREFKDSPAGRKVELTYQVSKKQSGMDRLYDQERRCKEAYNQLRSKNVVEKFLSRHKIAQAKDSFIAAKKRRDEALADIRRMQEELRALEGNSEKAA